MDVLPDERVFNRPEPEQLIKSPIEPLCKLLRLREEGCPRKRRYAHKQFCCHKEQCLVEKNLREVPCNIPGSPKSTFLMVFSPDGRHTASTHGDHNIYITETNSGKWVQTLTGHPRTPWCIAYHPSSPDLLASGCLGGEVRVWDMSGCCETWVQPTKTQIASVAFHPADNILAIATNNQIHIWNWELSEPFVTLTTADKSERVKYVKFDHMGFRLITGISNPPPPHRSGIHRNETSAARAARVAQILHFPTLQNDASPSPSGSPPPSSVRSSQSSQSLLNQDSTVNGSAYRSSGADDGGSSSTSSSSTSGGVLGTQMDADPPPMVNLRRDASTDTNGFDLEERTGEGNVMREFDVSSDLSETRQPARAEILRRRRARMQAGNPSRCELRCLWRAENRSSARCEPRYPPRGESRLSAGDRAPMGRKNGGGRWMYFSERDRPGQSTSGSQANSEESRPGPSRQSSRLDACYGVQLLSRHTENMQRICRSLATPRSSTATLLSNHRSEIPRLQHIRTMLFDIQRQIHSLRASVDRSMDHLPETAPSANSTSSIAPSGTLPYLAGPSSRPTSQSYRDFEMSLFNTGSISERIGSLSRVNEALNSHLNGSSSIAPAPRERTLSPLDFVLSPSDSENQDGAGSTVPDYQREQLEAWERRQYRRRASFERRNRWFQNLETGDRLTLPQMDLPLRNRTETVRNISTMDDVGRNLEEMAEDYWSDRIFETLPSERATESARVDLRRAFELPTLLTHTPSSLFSATSAEPEERRTPRPPRTSLSQRIVELFNDRYPNRGQESGVERSRSPIDGRVAPCRRRNSLQATGDSLARQNRIENYRNVLQHMANRLQTLMDQQTRTDESLNEVAAEQAAAQPSTSRSERLQRIIPPMENLRYLVHQALHLIYQLINFICNESINNEERPIARLPNPFREEDRQEDEDFSLNFRPGQSNSSSVSSIEPGLTGLNALLDAVRVASDELREETESSTRQAPPPQRLEDHAYNIDNDFPLGPLRRNTASRPARPWASVNNSRVSSGSSDGSDDDSPAVTPTLCLRCRVNAHNDPSRRCTHGDQDDSFFLRSQSGIPLRLLGRQNAVDERSDATDDQEDRGTARVNPLRAHPRRATRASDRYHTPASLQRNYFNTLEARTQRLAVRRSQVDQFIYHRPAARIIHELHPIHQQAGAQQATFRLQSWDFDITNLPDLCDRITGLVVPQCKIHFDASVSISDDSSIVAALVPGVPERLAVAVYSLVNSSLGDPLCTIGVNPDAICVSLSPTMRHLVIGIASPHARWSFYHAEGEVIASIYLVDGPEIEPFEMNDVREISSARQQFKRNLFLMRNLEMGPEARNISLNSIKWLPHPGQGFIYGTNRGQLTILR